MRSINGNRSSGYWVGKLPEGCRLCFQGSKIVVFVTGLCHDGCYYCPLSMERRSDVIYVDEERVEFLDDILREAYLVRAEGASITGGDPLIVPDRTMRIISMLKDEFGERFHIHLYTSGRYASRSLLEGLDSAGLDEIRFHPVDPRMMRGVELALDYTSMNVGVEVPVIPGDDERLKKMALKLEEIGADFMNLNELEVTETNAEALRRRGIKVSGQVGAPGSLETGLRIIKWAARNLRSLTVHLCPARYKDAVQTRNRLLRKAVGLRHLYEVVTRDATLLWAEVEPLSGIDPGILLGEGWIHRLGDGRYVTHPDALPMLRGARGVKLVEAHPTWSRLVVEEREFNDP